MTALAEERQQLEGYGAGADDYLPKPFSLAVLKAKIKNLLKRSEQLKLYFRDRFDLRTPEQTIADPDKEFLSKVTKVVLAHLQDPEFDVELFCSKMAMSRASLFRKLKSTTGCSASSFTRNIRIKRAAELLGQHAYSIGEVAAQVASPIRTILPVALKKFTGSLRVSLFRLHRVHRILIRRLPVPESNGTDRNREND